MGVWIFGSFMLLTVQLIPMAFPLFPTERALKRTFDKDGADKRSFP